MSETITVPIPITALDAATRVRIAELTRERDEARTHLYNARQSRGEYLCELNEIRHLLGAGPGVTALEAVKLAQKEAARLDGDEWARAKVLDDIRAAIGIDARGPGLVGAVRGVVAARASAEARARDALERGAAVQVEAETARKERDEAKALAQTEVTRASRLAIEVNTLRRLLDDMTKERDKAFACWRAAQTTWSRALSELEKVAGAK